MSLLALLLASAPTVTLAQPATEQATPELERMRAVIEHQLAAFRAHDAQAAWKVVAPGLKTKFGTADRFLRMVRDQYEPVYRPRSYEFGTLQPVDGGMGQWLHIVGPDGRSYRALYLMEPQPDGSWMTMGCMLAPPEEAPPRT
ncbi:MAG: DUF4864 domain-containing protein [Myxococcales bacterium]|nr:DUF4864 domain-containing protein [Myxococcales bacterium]